MKADPDLDPLRVVHARPALVQQLMGHHDALERLQGAVRIAIAVLDAQPALTDASLAEIEYLRNMTRARVPPLEL